MPYKLADVHDWKWPGCGYHVAGNQLVAWIRPLPAPTSTEIESAVQEYLANQATIETDKRVDYVDTDLKLRAAVQLDYEERQKLQVKAGQSLRSPAECRTRLKEIYRSLL